MRALGRIILILAITIPMLVLGNQIWSSLRWSELAATLGVRIESAVPSSAYLSIDDDWLDFSLSEAGHALRIRSNAVVDAHSEYLPDMEWWYAFEYRLLGADGEILREGVYHHRTRLTRFRNSETGSLESKNILLDPDVNPTDGRSMMIYFGLEQAPSHVRIRPILRDPALLSLMFRVYEQVPNPKQQAGYLWQRLGQSKKARLAQGSVYGLDLLYEQEKQNLLRYDWKAVGPLGVEDEQYRLTRLYIARELSGESMDETSVPYGLYCDRIVRGMIPLPDGEWEVTLDIETINEIDEAEAEIVIRWYGRDIAQRWQTRIPSGSGSFTLDEKFDGGQLEIVAPAPLVVRAWGKSRDTEIELTPEPLHVRSYLVDANGFLTVDIDHVAMQSTPFRIDIRAKLNSTEDVVARALAYEFLDADGNEIRSGRLAANLALSNYDRLALAEPGFNISEPVRYYFNLPANVTGLRFSSQDELLVATYTRPSTMPRKVRVPEDYQVFGDDQDKQPAWFLLRPAGEERLRREFRSNILVVQQRPPQTDPKLLSGDYDWQLYQPVGNWRARHLLIPRTRDFPARDRSLLAVFHEIDTGKPEQVTFRRLPGHREINPNLLYLRDRSSPLDIQLMLDGRPYSSMQIAGRQGELQLPPVMPGTQELTIEAAEPVRWFINQTEAKASSFLRRLAMQLTRGGLEFEYEKVSSGPEVLLGQLYTGSKMRPELSVTIAGEARGDSGPWQEWTFLDRQFDLRQEWQVRIPVLNSTIKSLNGAQRFFLPLGADLPPGKYRISFALDQSSDAYLTLYQLTGGQSEFRTLFRESAYVPATEL